MYTPTRLTSARRAHAASSPRAVALLLLLVPAAGAFAIEVPFQARIVSEFSHQADPPINMPTDVAVAPDGRVFIADGVNRRVVVLDVQARFVESIQLVGEEPLVNPTGLAIDADGKLYIADTGRHAVIVRSADGQLDRMIVPQSADDEYPADITGIAIEADGKAAWLVDNDNNRVIRFDLRTGTQSAMGRYGESVGELQHPFMIAVDADGDAFITDVINGRVAVFTRNGAPSQPVGAYGIELGQLYRPKGIACDEAANVWVSDSVLGVIQIFSNDGVPIDVLRDADGKPMRFNLPMGLAFDHTPRTLNPPGAEKTPASAPAGLSSHLYVTELGANRVVKLAIQRGPRPPPLTTRRRTQIVGGQARACTVCHVEWIEPFSRGQASSIAEPPPTSTVEPAVSRSDMCLSCHDASVVDSRRRVWMDHGHQTGIAAPDGMTIPDHLPLVDGKVACRTCHSAHTGGKFEADFRTAVFLRMQNAASELCISCHQDKTKGPEFGTHPIGGMPWPIPKELVGAGAKVGPNPRELTCQVCHTPHGSKNDHLLVMGTSSNQLCMTCHDQMRPGMFRDGEHTEHPLSPLVNAEQAAAVREMGTQLSPEGQLICLSCHKLHHGKGERFMLADDLHDGRFCIRCHSEKTQLVGSSHDLRTNFPEEKNRLGMTPISGGPCSSCHMFHRYARAPEASKLDPGGGKCITCHQSGRCAGDKSLGPVNHPDTRCVECHDPHDPQHKPYLKDTTEALCAGCHKDQTALIGGPHDYRSNQNLASSAWPAASKPFHDPCLSCHRPHGDESTGLFRFAGAVGGEDAGCRACHAASAWGATGGLAALHPREMKPGMPHGDLPISPPAESHAGGISCRTCHDPHGGSTIPAMLRVQPGATAQALCTACHTDMAGLALTTHNSASLAHAGFDTIACGPCHVVHGDAGKVASAGLMPRGLAGHDKANSPAALQAHDAAAGFDANCSVCHRSGGSARPPAIAFHPEVVLEAVAAAHPDASLPLFDEHGSASANGRITCYTCHLPHGRPADDAELTRLAGLSQEQVRAERLMLRPFNPPNICTACHGSDALRRFLYFHDTERRTGPLAALRSPAPDS